jgi:hypothetical protein
MRSSLRIALIGSLLACTLVLACTDDDTSFLSPNDAGGAIDAGLTDAPVAPTDAHSDGATIDSGRQKGCVERPTDLDRPPTGRLPCELSPPGLSL